MAFDGVYESINRGGNYTGAMEGTAFSFITC